jgi:hypothetical protein
MISAMFGTVIDNSISYEDYKREVGCFTDSDRGKPRSLCRKSLTAH